MKEKRGYYGTAVWKLNSPLENQLSHLADKSEIFKALYVLYYRIFDNIYYRKGIPMIDQAIDNFLQSNNNAIFPSKEWFRRDMIYSLHRFGADFDEYFVFEFYKRNTLGREEFITNKKRYEYYHLLNADENFLLFENKKNTYKIFKGFYKRDVLPVETMEDRNAFIDFWSRHNVFMYKPVGGAEGRGIKKVLLKSEKEALDFFDSNIENGSFLAEELISQDEQMALLNRSSVNTVRVPAVICKGKVKIFHPFVRMGVGESVVDNHGAGGIVASIDAATGIVYTPGLTKKGHWYLKHPDTGTQIVGFQIPCWDELVELANEITPLVDGTR